MTQVVIDPKKELLFRWVYSPFDIIFEDDTDKTNDPFKGLEYIKSLSLLYNIPGHIILFKIVEFFVKKNYPQDKIEHYLFKLKLISANSLATVIEIIKNIKDNFKDKEKKDITDTLSIIKQWDLHATHEGYPIPDPVKGRPRLEWQVCAYYGCGKKFDANSNDYPGYDYSGLKQHLKQLGKYRDYFHFHHEYVVEKHNLTPQKVLAQKITKCPSHLCDVKEFETPEEFCRHLIMLGIPPFWKQGMVIQPLDLHSDKKLENVTDRIHVEKECIICCEEGITPGILFLPCNHCVICIDCFCSGINKCPMCQTVIDKYLFF